MANEVIVVQQTTSAGIDKTVMEYMMRGYYLYGGPFNLQGGSSQIMVLGDLPTEEVGQYKIVRKISARPWAAEMALLESDGWIVFGNPYEQAGEGRQAMVKGNVLIKRTAGYEEPEGGGEIPADLLARLTAVETVAALVNTKATNAMAKANTADTTAKAAVLDITGLVDKTTLHDTAITLLGSQMLNKADLVSGKVPYEQLPEFPVGRKINVANKAARLALPVYTDLTIAYEKDTGDAWGLDANDSPATEANWSKLGNTQAIGVASFLGRTGNVAAQNGDYITDQISETLTKQFVTPEQKVAWSAKATTAQVDTKIATQKTADDLVYETKQHASDTYAPLGPDGKVPAANLPAAAGVDLTGLVPKTDINKANGIAPLDANSKVPVANLPAPPIWRTPAGRAVGTWYTNNSPHTMVLNLRTAESAVASRFLNVQTRANSSAAAFHQRSTAFSTTVARWIQLTAHVPPGWQYMVDTFGGSTTANTEYWQELS